MDFRDGLDIFRRKLDGILRYAAPRDWRLEMMPRDIIERISLQELRRRLEKFALDGIIVENSGISRPLPPRFFGRVPVVYLDPRESLPWRNAAAVSCDNAAVARAAFRELSSGSPPCCAVVPFFLPQGWVFERQEAFRALCMEAGYPCHVFPVCPGERPKAFIGRFHSSLEEADKIRADYSARLSKWVVGLPPHCAVFALNDTAAYETAAAFHAARRHVPHSATLVGADAVMPPPGEGFPGISSVRIDFEFSGFAAARLLGEKMAGLRAEGATFGPLLVERRQSTGGSGRREPRILEAVEIIRREACDGLTAAALAARFRGSRRLFEIRFREATGHSVLDEILQVRLERALVLLARRDVPIGAIASFSGFGCDYELRRLFRARFGVSLRQWRYDHA